MNNVEALITIFYSVLDEAGRRAVLKETLIDDQPSRHQEEYYDRIREWMRRHRAAIAPLLLRYVDPPDHLVEKLAAEGDLQIPRVENTPTVLSFSRLTDSDTSEAATATSSEIRCPDKLPVLDLAIASGFVSELFVDVARANRLCGGEVDPPHATVTRGSFDFTLSGGLFASGVGLLVACSAGLVGAPLVGPLAGATLATAGVIDLALGWRKVIADTRKAHADSRLLEMDIRVKQLELQAKELELEKAKLLSETETSFDPHLGVFRHSRDEVPWPPESAAVPRRLVRSTADKLKMNETYANHLLNRCLPKLRLLKQKLAGSSITCQMWNEQ